MIETSKAHSNIAHLSPSPGTRTLHLATVRALPRRRVRALSIVAPLSVPTQPHGSHTAVTQRTHTAATRQPLSVPTRQSHGFHMHGVLVAKPILAPTPQQLTSQLHSMHSNMTRHCAATETRCDTGVLDIDTFTLRHANTSPRNTAIILVCNRTIQPPPFHSSSHPVEDSLITTFYLPHFAPYHS